MDASVAHGEAQFVLSHPHTLAQVAHQHADALQGSYDLTLLAGKQSNAFLNQLLAQIPGEVEVLWDNSRHVTAPQAAWDS